MASFAVETDAAQADAMDAALGRLIRDIVRRPGMYTGRRRLSVVVDYLSGYCHGLSDCGKALKFYDWQRWVEYRFGVFHPGWHWSRILHHFYETEEKALDELPELYQEFLQQAAVMTAEQMESKLRAALRERHGQDWYEPPETHTRPTSEMESRGRRRFRSHRERR